MNNYIKSALSIMIGFVLIASISYAKEIKEKPTAKTQSSAMADVRAHVSLRYK